MRKTIMIVDDSATVRQMVSFTLGMAEHEVIVAADGKDALSKMKEKRVHMMITDLIMPEMDGIELIRAVRAGQDHRFIPIVMLTTETRSSKKQEGKAAGATGWMVKPFKPKQLLGVVRKVLG